MKRNLYIGAILWLCVLVMLVVVQPASSITPCANMKTDQTTWQVGIKINDSNPLCSEEGLDSDLLAPDIYTQRYPR